MANLKKKLPEQFTQISSKIPKQLLKFIVYDAGLSVFPLWPFLGASLDGKVYDQPDSIPPFGLLEIKCPFTKRGGKMAEVTNDNGFLNKEMVTIV